MWVGELLHTIIHVKISMNNRRNQLEWIHLEHRRSLRTTQFTTQNSLNTIRYAYREAIHTQQLNTPSATHNYYLSIGSMNEQTKKFIQIVFVAH